jgi:hypothetical protein
MALADYSKRTETLLLARKTGGRHGNSCGGADAMYRTKSVALKNYIKRTNPRPYFDKTD